MNPPGVTPHLTALTARFDRHADQHLQLAGTHPPLLVTPWTASRPPLLRLCAGEPLLLADTEVDLVALVNRAAQITPWLLDDASDPDDYRLAEVMMEYLCHRFGTQRRGKGDRFKDLESIYRRHLLPFLIELDAGLPAEQRGVAAKRLPHLERLPAILAGDAPLPAATVAGDQLHRRGVACVYLHLDDAARVAVGGAPGLEVALSDGRLTLHRDARTGADIVRAADLRESGLLIERTSPHGCAASTATKVLSDLKNVLERARDHGATMRGTFRLVATEPLSANRMRPQRGRDDYVPVSDIVATTMHLPPICQVVLWLERLTGLRISENFGARIFDYWRDPTGQAWLRIDKQGGLSSLGRERQSGQLVRQDGKDHTKTEAGVRTIPLPEQLAALLDHLIGVFHTDAETGEVDPDARLIPGIQSENTSGQSSFRTRLATAQERAGTVFRPHALRAALITDLKDAGVPERLAHYYAGHEQPHRTIQDEHYDTGPDPALLLSIARLLEERLRNEPAPDDLLTPTDLREQWGTATRRYRQRDWIKQQLILAGWAHEATTQCRPSDRAEAAGSGALLSSREVAARIGKSEGRARIMMARGDIIATRHLSGRREVWVASAADVQQYLDEHAGASLNEVAAELALDYHQTWQLARDLGLLEKGRLPRGKVRLTAADTERLRHEVTRRRAVQEQAVTVREAAEELQMAVTLVQTLVRREQLELVPGPTSARDRYVSRASVQAYLAAHLVPTDQAYDPEDALLSCTQAARVARITRPQLTTLIATYQVRTRTKPGSRHVYITSTSLIEWAERTSQPVLGAAIRALADRSAR